MHEDIYLIGSLRNPNIPVMASKLRGHGISVFDSWYAAGPDADDCWRDYETAKGCTYQEALDGWAAQNVFNFDVQHLKRCNGAVLVMPAGKSAHLELGFIRGLGKPGWIYFTEIPERFDVMHNFATAVHFDVDELAADILCTLHNFDEKEYIL